MRLLHPHAQSLWRSRSAKRRREAVLLPERIELTALLPAALRLACTCTISLHAPVCIPPTRTTTLRLDLPRARRLDAHLDLPLAPPAVPAPCTALSLPG